MTPLPGINHAKCKIEPLSNISIYANMIIRDEHSSWMTKFWQFIMKMEHENRIGTDALIECSIIFSLNY